eukprot:TRINITY_DN78407_c0_g1_i1.p2 TRINITY_DN78407_c0_g1~~TRINITY_DN78407_c0_g1_i1.p2  ORF type:complete len:135 (+),score=43.38 TRINITY_DN78407_c0_g1_i1:63-467(+)
MALVGGYSSDEDEDEVAQPTTSSNAPGSAAAGSGAGHAAQPSSSACSKQVESEEESDEESDEPGAKRQRTDASSNPLGLLPTRIAGNSKDRNSSTGKKPPAAVTAFVPSQARKTGRVVSTVTDGISDRAFAKNE